MVLDLQALASVLLAAGLGGVCWYARTAIEKVEHAQIDLAVARVQIALHGQEIEKLRAKCHDLANEVASHMLTEERR